jgi:endonuclease/exonuclease/phosphatase family metal-dependent hydrolase
VGAAVGRLLLCLPPFTALYLGAAITVGFGALFLAKAVGYLDRRNLAAALALAFVLDALLRLGGAGYSLAQRPDWLPVQAGLALGSLLLAGLWLRDPAPEEDGDEERTLERRQGGLRLRGALALAVLLFLELNVLARPEVAAQWSGLSYRVVGAALVAAGAAAVVLLLAAPVPIGRHRPAALTLAALATLGAAVASVAALAGVLRLALFVAAHASALLLFGRAMVPATGRRRGWTLASGLTALLVLNALFAFTFFYAFTVPALQGDMHALIVTAGLFLAALLALIPRPLGEPPPLRRWRYALPLAAALGLAAWLVTPAPPAPSPPDAGAVTVATYNVHYGFDERWRYDPERIARTIEESGAGIVALQEVAVGVLAVHGTDLPRWLGQRLRMRVLLAPAINGLLGDAVLTRLPILSFDVSPLPPALSDRKTIARTRVLTGRAAGGADTLTLLTTHLGLVEAEQKVQLTAALGMISATEPAVLMGDLNATGESQVARALQAAGFRDAFLLAGAPPEPTAPADRPVRRIDWIWVRGLMVDGATVSMGPGSDHRLVAASIRRGAFQRPVQTTGESRSP